MVRVFIIFGGPQGYEDRMASCAPIANRRKLPWPMLHLEMS